MSCLPQWIAARAGRFGLLAAVLAALLLAPRTGLPQSDQPPSEPQPESTTAAPYKPPLRGAPGGRVGGASRGSVKAAASLPTIDLLAPGDHAGLTANALPTLYFFVSQPVAWPTQLTISAPLQPAPVVEVTIPSPRSAGIHAVRLADYRVSLNPGIAYTWSISIIVDPRTWARNIVASATILHSPPDPAVAGAANRPPLQRSGLYAQAGYWYDAVAAAYEAGRFDGFAALTGLMRQVGLAEPTHYARAQR